MRIKENLFNLFYKLDDISLVEEIDHIISSFKQGGYLSSDLNGDSIVDASDAVIADNNAYKFVSVIRP